MRLLMFGHWSDTGFGIVTQNLAKRFFDAGVDVRVIAQNHRGNPIQGPLASRIWPANIKGDGTGGNVSQEAAIGKLWLAYDSNDFWLPDAALMIADAGTLWGYLGHKRPMFPDRFGAFGSLIPTWNYVPIEGDNLNASWRDVWERISPVAMSKYGQGVIQEHIGRDVPMIYHGVDTEAFYPVGPGTPIRTGGLTMTSKIDCKVGAGADPDGIMLLRTDRLVERKQYHVLFESLVPVFAKHPKVHLVLHTHPVQPPLNMYEEVARIPEEFHPRIRLTGGHDTYTGLPPEAMNALYNAADIYVSPTAGEGFGLTLAESLACEVPVVTTDYAAGPEIMAPGGLLARPLHDSYNKVVRIHSNYGMDWAQPDPITTTAAIMRLVEKPALRRELGRAGRMHVKKMFSWDKAAADFIDLFTTGVAEWVVREPA